MVVAHRNIAFYQLAHAGGPRAGGGGAGERRGLRRPPLRGAGAWPACMGQLVEGDVGMRHNHVLDANDLKQGWILACQSVPKSSRLHLRYPS